MRATVVVGVVCVAMGGTAEAGSFGIIVPPIDVSLGRAVTGAPDGEVMETTQLVLGLSWASLYPRSSPVDFGVGVMTTTQHVGKSHVVTHVHEDGELHTYEDHDYLDGTYVYVAVRMLEGRSWRTWIGARGEMMDLGEHTGLGAVGRASIELYSGGVGGQGFFSMGTVAVTAWAEAGVREQPQGGGATFVAAGMGFRFPLFVMVQ